MTQMVLIREQFKHDYHGNKQILSPVVLFCRGGCYTGYVNQSLKTCIFVADSEQNISFVYGSRKFYLYCNVIYNSQLNNYTAIGTDCCIVDNDMIWQTRNYCILFYIQKVTISFHIAWIGQP